MNVVTEQRDGVNVFRLVGELDARSAPAIRDQLVAVTAADTRPRAIVDLERLTYVDSAGLGALVVALKAFAAKSGKLVLAAPRPEVRHILSITRMLQHFAVVDGEAEAWSALG